MSKQAPDRAEPTYTNVETMYDKYADFYDLCVNPNRSDIACYLDLAQDCRKVIDVGCGTGRLVGPLLLAGLEVIAVDISTGMLAACARKTTDVASERLTLVAHDFCNAPIATEADLAILSYFTINYILDSEMQLAMLTNIAASLRTSGRLAMECFCPKSLSVAPDRWREDEIVISADPFLARSDIRQMRGDTEDRLQTYRFKGEKFHFASARRYLSPAALAAMLRSCGLVLEWISFDHGRTRTSDIPPVGPDRSFIAVARKSP